MRKAWSIGKHRVKLEITGYILTVRLDEDAEPVLALRSNLLGTWPFRVGDRVVELRRVRNLDVARNDLWVNGVKVPPSAQPIAWREPPVDARCKPHPMNDESYRSSALATTAILECGVCGAPVCADCSAADGVRCKGCFERAAQELRKRERASRIMGPIAAVALTLLVGIVGLVARSPKVFACATGMAGLIGFLMIRGLWRERIEARVVSRDR